MMSGRFWWLLLVLTLAGLWLRLDGIAFGLPYEYHVDESQHVRRAARMGQEGLEPTWWNNPPFYKYLLLAADGVLYAGGRAAGAWASPAEFGARMDGDPTPLYLIGRGASAIFGALTVLLTGWAGRVGWNERVGLLAAGFTAVAFILVRESHFATNDALATFFTTLAVLAALGIQAAGGRRWYVAAGIALGLGFATKYTAAFAIMPVLLAHALRPDVGRQPARWRLRQLGLLAAVAAGAALLASPYFAITPGRVVHDIYHDLYLPGREGFEGRLIDPDGGYLYYLKSLRWGLGDGLFALSAAGLGWALWRRRPAYLIAAILPLLLYLLMGRQEMFFARFLLPAVPPLLLLAAVTLVDLQDSRLVPAGRAAWPLTLLLACLLALPSLAASLRANALLQREDTRTLAQRWMQENLPPQSRIVVEWDAYSPQFSEAETFSVSNLEFDGIYVYETDHFLEQKVDYLVATSFIYNVPRRDPAENGQAQARYAALDSRFDLVYEISPYAEGVEPAWVYDEIYGPATALWERQRPGPVLKIYRVTAGDERR